MKQKPKLDKHEVEKNKLLSKAAQVFNKHGYQKTKMETIAKAAGKAKSSVYYYFKSKDEVFKAVVLNEGIAFRRTIIEAISTNETPKDKIKTYILTRMRLLQIYKNFYSALKYDKLRNIEFVSRLNHLYDMEEIRLFKHILKEGVDNNFFKINDINLAAVGIVMAIKGIENMILREQLHTRTSAKIDDLINIILYGIVKN